MPEFPQRGFSGPDNGSFLGFRIDPRGGAPLYCATLVAVRTSHRGQQTLGPGPSEVLWHPDGSSVQSPGGNASRQNPLAVPWRCGHCGWRSSRTVSTVDRGAGTFGTAGWCCWTVGKCVRRLAGLRVPSRCIGREGAAQPVPSGIWQIGDYRRSLRAGIRVDKGSGDCRFSGRTGDSLARSNPRGDHCTK